MTNSARDNLPLGVKACLANIPSEPDTSNLPTLATINTFRAGWANFAKPEIAGPLADDIVIQDYPVNTYHQNPLPIRLFTPPNNTKKPQAVILCTSGGGFIANLLETNQTPWSRLAKATELPVITYQYTTAPEAAFNGSKPRGIADAELITEWLFTHAKKMNFDDSNIFLAGDSSGGNFAIYQAYSTSKKGLKPKGLILISPATDLSRTFIGFGNSTEEFESYKADEDVDTLLSAPLVEACCTLYAPDPSSRNSPLISPLYISDLTTHLPPTTIIVASCDRLKRDAFALKKKLDNLAELHILPGTHAFLTARGLFGNEPGPDPVLVAANAITSILNKPFQPIAPETF